MKKLIFSALLTLPFMLQAQDIADWSLEGMHKKMWMTQLETGKVIVQNENNLMQVDNETGNVEWELEDLENFNDPILLDNVAYIYQEGKSFHLINADNGEILVSKSEKTKVDHIHYYMDLGYVLMELTADKADDVLVLDLREKKAEVFRLSDKKDKPGMFSLKALFSSGPEKPFINEDNTVALIRKKDLYVMSVATGEVKGKVSFEKDVILSDYNYDEDILYIKEDKKHLYGVSLGNAEQLWKIEHKDDIDVYGLNGGAQLMLEEKKKLHFINGKDGSSIVTHDLNDKPRFIEFYEDKIYVGDKKILKIIDPSSAQIVNETAFKNDLNGLRFMGEQTYIYIGNKVNEINLNDMSLKYSKGLEIGRVDYVYPTDDHMVFIGNAYGSIKAVAIDPSGEKVWDNSWNSEGKWSADKTGAGLMIVTSEKIDHIDLKNGKSTWKNDISKKESCVLDYNEELNKLAILNEKRPYIVDMGTGEIKKGEKELEFKDFKFEEQTPKLLYLKEGVFAKGSNSISLVGNDASILYKKHYKKSNNSGGLMKLAVLATQVGAAATGNADEIVTVYSGGEKVHQGALVEGSNDAWASADQMNERRRRLANAGSLNLPFVFTKLENKQRGFVFIDPASGEHIREIEHDDKEPNYIVDATDRLLILHDKKSGKLLGYKIDE